MTNYERDQEELRYRKVLSKPVPFPCFEWLKKACWNARKEENKINRKLLGHIKEEYKINDIPFHFNDFIIEDCLSTEIMLSYTRKLTVTDKDRPFFIDNLWCNFQKKHEFNPPHNHSGIYSFVIFVQIPYNLKEEENVFPEIGDDNRPDKANYTSKFAFINADPSGEIRCDPLNIDQSYVGKLLMFPAKQLHEVFPFYTTDEYRITVSGNIRLKV